MCTDAAVRVKHQSIVINRAARSGRPQRMVDVECDGSTRSYTAYPLPPEGEEMDAQQKATYYFITGQWT